MSVRLPLFRGTGLDAIRTKTGATVTLVHYSGKDPGKGTRGSNALLAAADTEIQCYNGRLKNTKQRSAEEVTPVHFALEEVAGSVVPVETHKAHRTRTKRDQVLRALQDAYEVHGPVTSKQWEQAAAERGIGRTSYFDSRKQLLLRAAVVTAGEGMNKRFAPVETTIAAASPGRKADGPRKEDLSRKQTDNHCATGPLQSTSYSAAQTDRSRVGEAR